jgi:hypothetical protein
MIPQSSEFSRLITYGSDKSAILYVFACAHRIRLKDNKGYLDIHPDGSLSYMDPANISPYVYQDAYNSTKRVNGRPARIIRSLLPDWLLPLFDDSDFEQFADTIKAFLGRSQGTFRLVPAADIPDWYHENRIPNDIPTGTLAASCMRHYHAQDYLNFYTTLGESVSLLVFATPDDNLLGRALVWRDNSGVSYMDRAYGTQPTIQLFHDYARQSGWWKKTDDSYSRPRDYTDPNGNSTLKTIRIPVDTWPELGFPYMDTMKFLNLERHVLSNSSRDAHLRLEDIDGGFDTLDRFHQLTVPDHARLGRREKAQLIWATRPSQPTLNLPEPDDPPPQEHQNVTTHTVPNATSVTGIHVTDITMTDISPLRAFILDLQRSTQ